MKQTSYIVLNLAAPNYATVYAAQDNLLSRYVSASLFDGNTPWVIPAGTYMEIAYIKPDGTGGFYDTTEDDEVAYTFSGNTVEFVLAQQAITVPGIVLMALHFFNADNQQLSSFSFKLSVPFSTFPYKQIESENYFNVMQGTLAEMAEAGDKALIDLQEAFEGYDAQMQAAVAEAEEAKNYAQAFTGAPRTAATAAAMTDHSLIYVYTGSETGYTNGHWYYWDGTAWADGGVYNSTAFTTDPTLSIAGMAADAAACGDLKSSLELNTGYKEFSWTENKYIPLGATGATTSGTPTTDADTDCVLVPCSEGDVITITATGWTASAYRMYGFLSAPVEGVYTIIKASPLSLTTANKLNITTPENAAYLAVNAKRANEHSVVKGTPLVDVVNSHISAAGESIGYIAPQRYTKIVGKSVDSTTGEERDSTTFDCTDFISIDPYVFNEISYGRIVTGVSTTTGMAFYDADKNYLFGQAALVSTPLGHREATINVPILARFARFSFRKDSVDTFFINFINSGKLQKEIERYGYMTAAPLEFCPPGLYENQNITDTGLTTAAEVYAAYDALMTDHPGSTKSVIGYASDANGNENPNLPIYAYVFQNAVTGDRVTPAPKVLLTSGIHGGEKVAVVGLYNFVKSLSDGANSIASAINFACEFCIVPLINPDGFNNNRRTNAHGVDLNRNFGANWGGHAGQGSAPYSEPETRALTAWLQANADALFHIDFHNHNQIDQGSTSIMYYIASEVEMHRKAWSFTFRAMIQYFQTEYNVDIASYNHVFEGNTVAGVSNEAYTNCHIDSSILETPVGDYTTHARKTTEVTGDFILCLLKNYRV